MTRRALWVLAALTLATAACSVPTESGANPVAVEDLPPDLQPVVTEATTTTAPPVGAEVTIYLYNTEEQLLEPVTRTIDGSVASVEDALRELFTATPTERERGRNLITQLVADPAEGEDEPTQLELLEVDTAEEFVRVRIRGTPAGQNQVRAQAFAQIVFTASQLELQGARPDVRIQNPEGDQQVDTTESAIVINGRVSRADYTSLDPDLEPEQPLNTGPRPQPTSPATTTTPDSTVPATSTTEG